MKISLLAALAENRVIGHANQLPWHLPADLRRFKQLTLGHVIVMGRRTFESIGRPLPERRSIVVSRNLDYQAEGATTVASLDAALAEAAGEDEVFVIGGAEIFRQALPRADRLYLTRVYANVPGDVLFPELALDDWELVDEESFPADPRHAHPYRFQLYERRR